MSDTQSPDNGTSGFNPADYETPKSGGGRGQTLTVILIAALVLGAMVYFDYRQTQRLDAQISELQGTVVDLHEIATSAEERAGAAEERARQAEESAGQAADRAVVATERERQSLAEAEAARLAEEQAKASEAEAQQERDRALQEAQNSVRAKRQAEQALQTNQKLHQEALRDLDDARLETMRAQTENRRLQAKMDQELDRLQGALGRIADTKKTALGLVMTLDSSQIEFDFNKADLRPQNRETLARIAGVLLTFNDFGVQIFGHTDDVGSQAYNQQLSKFRAEAVKAYLTEAGVPEESMATLGMGKSAPLVEGTDPAARQRNRRVELAIVFSEGEYEALQPEAADEP